MAVVIAAVVVTAVVVPISVVVSSVVEIVVVVFSEVLVVGKFVVIDSSASKMECLNLYKQNTYFDVMLKEKFNLKL